MKALSLFVAVVFFVPFILSGCGFWGDSKKGRGKGERDYSSAWCVARGGDDRAVLADGTRPDCLLRDAVVEFDFAEGTKPYECAGQARHYAKVTGLRPLCVLIRRNKTSAEELRRAASRVDAPVVCMNADGEMIACE